MGRKHSKRRKGKAESGGARHAAVEPVVRIASAMMDSEAKKLYVFSDDMLINQLRREGPRIEASFDTLCANDMAELSALFSKANGLFFSGMAVGMKQDDDLRVACSQLLMNAANSFAAAVAVLRMGYVLQPGIILRSLLEAVSTALHLLQNPKDLHAYKSHTLQSPKTIAAAKKALPPFGLLYGSFSDNFAHIGHLHKSITPIREYTEKHEALDVNLSLLRIACWLLYVTAELVFNDVIEHPRYWHPVDQGYAYDPSDEEKAWMQNFFQFIPEPP
ncbi:MAG: hypothetical protein ACT6SF_08750 [Hydrogenophaga sp.]|uniref:hypothetical protein n=1 Tax=Hydrogenophaga sp. TaxID=1904254 RepID=UPI0040361765